MGQLENYGPTLWISGFGGVASADVTRRFGGALYARLNPPMETLVEMDTKDKDDLQRLRKAAEDFLRGEGGEKLKQAAGVLKELTARQASDQEAPLRILCIDGGGIKGLVPAIVLQQLGKLCGGRPLHELFDLACGTSTGGIIALGTCAAGQPIETMSKVYEEQVWARVSGACAAVTLIGGRCLWTAGRRHLGPPASARDARERWRIVNSC